MCFARIALILILVLALPGAQAADGHHAPCRGALDGDRTSPAAVVAIPRQGITTLHSRIRNCGTISRSARGTMLSSPTSSTP